MIRRVLGLKWSDRVTNINLYARCGISPASLQVVNARWRLFGHTLRMNEGSPAREAMAIYFMHDKSMSGRGGNRMTLPTALSNDYYSMFGKYIKTTKCRVQ